MVQPHASRGRVLGKWPIQGSASAVPTQGWGASIQQVQAQMTQPGLPSQDPHGLAIRRPVEIGLFTRSIYPPVSLPLFHAP